MGPDGSVAAVEPDGAGHLWKLQVVMQQATVWKLQVVMLQVVMLQATVWKLEVVMQVVVEWAPQRCQRTRGCAGLVL